MNYEVKNYRFTCDACKVSEILRDQAHWKRPDGWGTRTIRNCGMTGYDRDEDLCPKCLAKEPPAPKPTPWTPVH